MRPEERLVFTLSDPNFEENHEGTLDFPLEGLDWRFIVGRAIHERTFLAFTRNLSKLDQNKLNKIPANVLRVMRKIRYSFLGQKLVFYRELEEIFGKLSGAGVIFMPMKGLLMNETVYPEDFRFFRDVDLLFPDTHELLKAEEVFRKLGYSSNSPTVNGVSYRKPISKTLIPTFDLHRSISFSKYFEFPRYERLLREIWNKTRKLSIGGVLMEAMAPEHMLIITLLDSFKDGFLNMNNLYDIIQMRRIYPKMDTSIIERSEKRFGCAIKVPLQVAGINNLEKRVTGFPIYYHTVCRKCKNNLCSIRPRSFARKKGLTSKIMMKVDDFQYLPFAIRRYGTTYGLRALTKMILSNALYAGEYIIAGGEWGSLYPGLRKILWN